MSEAVSPDALALLRELTVIPQVVGYDHRIAELDDAGLIEWKSGEGYFASDAGRAALNQTEARLPAVKGGES